MIKKDIVAFDVDEVLFPLRQTLIKGLNRRFGFNLSTDNFDSFSFIGWLRRDHPNIARIVEQDGGKLAHFKYISKKEMLIETDPYEGAANTVRTIKSIGQDVAIVTFRGTLKDPGMFYRDGPGETLQWLRRYRIPFDYIIFTDKKGLALKKLEGETNQRVLLYAEDHPANVVQVVDAGYDVALVDKPYNQKNLVHVHDETDYGIGRFTDEDWTRTINSEKVHRIRSLDEIIRIIQNKG